jgi:hypothetical protein
VLRSNVWNGLALNLNLEIFGMIQDGGIPDKQAIGRIMAMMDMVNTVESYMACSEPWPTIR